MIPVSAPRASEDRRASETSRGHETNGASGSQLAAGVCFAPDLQSCALTFCQFDHANSKSVQSKQRHLSDARVSGARTPVCACVPCVSPRADGQRVSCSAVPLRFQFEALARRLAEFMSVIQGYVILLFF